MAENAARQPEHRLRRARRKISRRRQGVSSRAVNAQLDLRPAGKRRVFLFIHGFNTMFAEGLYREVQVVHDAKAPGVPVLFTWASRGKPTAYIYDTNSATAARDELEHTLRLLLASNAEEVNVLAHSMGNWVTVEAFRQIKISGNLDHVSKLGYVFLAAPDIDIDVFKSEMRRFGKPKKPFYIVLSKDDKALWLSRNRRRRRHPGRRQPRHRRAGGAGRDRDRPDRCQGQQFHQPRQIRSARRRRAPAAQRPRRGDRCKSPRHRLERWGRGWAASARSSPCRSRCLERPQDHRRSIDLSIGDSGIYANCLPLPLAEGAGVRVRAAGRRDPSSGALRHLLPQAGEGLARLFALFSKLQFIEPDHVARFSPSVSSLARSRTFALRSARSAASSNSNKTAPTNHSLVLSSAVSHRPRSAFALSHALRSAACGSCLASCLGCADARGGVLRRFGGLRRRSSRFWRRGDGLLLLGRQIGGLGGVLHANSPPLHRLLQFRFAFLLDLARGGDHDMADHAARRLGQFTAGGCFRLRNFNYRLGLGPPASSAPPPSGRLLQRIVQVEVFGGDQRVGDRLLGQVTPFEIVRDHQDQGVFSAAAELHVARRDAGAFASGGAVSPVEDHPLEQHDGIDQAMRANVVRQVLQFVFVRRRNQEGRSGEGLAARAGCRLASVSLSSSVQEGRAIVAIRR